jgi:VRR-NUC domain
MIDERIVSLQSLDLGSEIRSLYSANYGRRCRPIWNWDKFSPDQLASVATAIPTTELLQILVRILRNYGQARSGLPDLFLWKPGSCAFVEVKGPRDKLASHQVELLTFLYKLRFRVFVVRVEES